MTEPAAAPGWHPDPRGGSGLRWHDGTAWTDHVHELAPPAPVQVSGAAAPAAADAAAEANALAEQLLAQARSQSHLPEHGSNRAATAALVTGLVGVPLVPTLLGILAMRSIRASAGQLRGRGPAIAGIVLGVVNVVVVAFVVMSLVPTFEERMDPAIAMTLVDDGGFVGETLDQCAAAAGGSYAACDGAAIAAMAPGLAPRIQQCGEAHGLCIHPDADGRGYTFVLTSQGTVPITYAQQRTAEGRVLRTCMGDACPDGAPSDSFPIPAGAPAAVSAPAAA